MSKLFATLLIKLEFPTQLFSDLYLPKFLEQKIVLSMHKNLELSD